MEKVEETVTTSSVAPEQVVRTTQRVVTPAPVGVPEHPQQEYKKKKVLFRTHKVIWYIVAVIDTLLGFRILLLALGANPNSGFTNLIYALSNPLSSPFRGILSKTVTSGAIFDWSIIIAAAVYTLIGFGIVELLQLIKPVSKNEVENTLDKS